MLLLLLLVAVAAQAHEFTEEKIKCKVCERAVSHVWARGSELQTVCKTAKGVDRDERCDFDGIHPWAIDRMVWGVCDSLPKTYQAIHRSEFDLILDEDPRHSDELVDLIRETCIRFLHVPHGVDHIGRTVLGHLRSGHDERVLRPMTRLLCKLACEPPPPKPKRQRQRWEDDDDDDGDNRDEL